jgi:DNA polymerase-3 subunit delta
MNKADFTMEDLSSRIFNFIEHAQSANQNIQFNFSIDEKLKNKKFSSVVGVNLYRTIQESVNNAMKYANAHHIVINAAKRYPMMSERQVVVVKEAQAIRNMEELSYYLQKPLNSTILVLCHKHGVLDRRKKLAAEIEKVGVLFESKKVKDAQLPAFITSYMKRKGVDLDPKATSMLADFVGTDLSRLTGELEKLIITLPKGQTRVTPEQIERNIGISKDYNNFELRSAIVEKDILKANKIIKYFEENPKTNPIQMTLSLLFGFFSNLMLAYYAPEKTEQGIASFIGLKTPWQSREYLSAMRRYSGVKTMQIIGEIRYADAKSKGVGNSSLSDGDILRELVFKILH